MNGGPSDLGPGLDKVRHDVLTRLEQLARELEANEAHFRDIIMRYADGILIVGPDGRIRFANPAAELIMGCPTEDLEGTTFDHPLASGELSDVELVLPDGDTSIVEIRVAETTWDGESVFLLSLHDVTQRARTTEALAESEHRFDLAVQGSGDGLWDWDLVSGKVYYSPTWCAMVGLGPQDPDPDPESWFDRVHPDDVDDVTGAITRCLKGPDGRLEIQYRLRHADGGYRWMRCRAQVVRDDGGRARRVTGLQTDVTDWPTHP